MNINESMKGCEEAMRVNMGDGFWLTYQKLVAKEAIPYQWKALNNLLKDIKPSFSVRNFKIAAGLETGEFQGRVFQDSDLYKWIEGAAYTLKNFPRKSLEEQVDEIVDLIVRAQYSDGYINTYYQLSEGLEKRWSNLRDCHELYCAGHMIEAAVAYWEMCGKNKLLEAAVRFADYLVQTFGKEEGKIHGYPGHQEIELAMVRLFGVTGKTDYLELAEYFIRERGNIPNYFDEEAKNNKNPPFNHKSYRYNQSDMPLLQQKEITGHAVRAMYFMTAATAVAGLKREKDLEDAVERIWEDLVRHKLFITGGIGASAFDEAFAGRYDLPNDTAYNETCASVGLVFWARQMMRLSPKGEYGDVMERALYNSALAGMSLDGKRFFYVNPLQVDDVETLQRKDHEHVSGIRQKWFDTACCPPNLARLIESLGEYFYTVKNGELYVNLYGESCGSVFLGTEEIYIEQKTAYPWNGTVNIIIGGKHGAMGRIHFRIPSWSEEFQLSVNGILQESTLENGFITVERVWEGKTTVTLQFDMTPKRNYASTCVREDIGRVAVSRGPLIYAIEECDNGKKVAAFFLENGEMEETVDDNLLRGAVYLKLPGKYVSSKNPALYSFSKPEEIPYQATAIPYFMWQNRGEGEMRVWLHGYNE